MPNTRAPVDDLKAKMAGAAEGGGQARDKHTARDKPLPLRAAWSS